jgi:hypothetical protein
MERRRRQEKAENHRAGLVAAVLVNIHSKKKGRPVTPGDFFGEPRQAARRTPWQQQLQLVKMLSAVSFPEEPKRGSRR